VKTQVNLPVKHHWSGKRGNAVAFTNKGIVIVMTDGAIEHWGWEEGIDLDITVLTTREMDEMGIPQ
jgi:hypothetical protein